MLPCRKKNFSFFRKRFYFYLFLERGEGREKERERNIDVPEIHQLIVSCMSPTGDPTHNPGMCRDQE